MTTEFFLRKWFGLEGAFYPPEYEAYIKHHEDGEEYDGEILTDEAMECWDRATALVEDLAALGAIDDETKQNILHSFCDNS